MMDKEKIRGRIEKIVTITKGVLVGDKWGTWTDLTEKYVKKLAQGDYVAMELNDKKQIIFITKVESADDMPKPTEEKVGESRDDKIVRGMCFNNATVLLANNPSDFAKSKLGIKALFDLAEALFIEAKKRGY